MDEREPDMGELLNLVGLSMGVVLYAMLLAMVVRAPSVSIAHGSGDLPLAAAILGLPGTRVRSDYELEHRGFAARVTFVSGGVFGPRFPSGRRGAFRASVGTRRVDGRSDCASLIRRARSAALHIRSLRTAFVLGMRLLTYVFVALVLPVAFVSRRQPGARRAVWIAALAAFAVSALHLAQLHTGRDPWPVELLGHHASVPLALAILYQDYPFAFADLFLKRALMLTALVAAAFIGIAALGLRGQGGVESLVIVGPRDVGLIVTLWVATALMYPWLHRGIGWFVDAIVLGRPDYSSLRATVARRVQEHDQIGPLLDECLRAARACVERRVHELA